MLMPDNVTVPVLSVICERGLLSSCIRYTAACAPMVYYFYKKLTLSELYFDF